jgi:RNA polymerase sigma-54 factor
MKMNKMRQVITQKQTQSLLLKPKMLQSLEMLAMPLLDLELHLKQEMIINPMLELQEFREEEEITNEQENAKEATEEIKNTEETEDLELKKTLEETQKLSEILDSYNEYYEAKAYKYQSVEKVNLEQFLKVKEDKKKDFLSQLDKLKIQDEEYDFAYELIESVNEYGFLPEDFSVYGLASEYGISEERADEIHEKILHLEPCGITARGIQECLLAQLTNNQENSVLIEVIRENFNDLIHKKYKKIASKFGVTIKSVLTWKEQISKLDPKPGLRIATSQTNYIVPDVIIKKIDKEYEIIINDFYFPRIRMSRRYKEILGYVKQDRKALDYVRNKINSAKFLIKSVYLRGRTLERVTKAIIRNQTEFFYGSTGILQPLTYSVIAEELQVNESTISRVVRNKYADTPFGIICLKDFFTSRAGKDINYNSISRQNVETKIKKLIDNEDEREPLSDQEIAEKLKEMGINVSRRVIAKYRKAKGILNSHLRRKL